MPTGVSRQISLVIDGYSAHVQDVTSMILGNVKRPLPLAFKMKHSCLQQSCLAQLMQSHGRDLCQIPAPHGRGCTDIPVPQV